MEQKLDAADNKSKWFYKDMFFLVFRLNMREKQIVMLTDRINEMKSGLANIRRLILFSEQEIKELKKQKSSENKVLLSLIRISYSK